MSRVLMVTPFYPLLANPCHGAFVRDLAAAVAGHGEDVSVLAPVPIVPPGCTTLKKRYGQLAQQPPRSSRGRVMAHFPRIPLLPGARLPRVVDLVAGRILERYVNAKMDARFDVLHAHGVWPIGSACRRIAEARRIPIISQVHGRSLTDWLARDDRMARRVTRQLRESAAIVAVSAATLRTVRTALGAWDGRLRVLGNGADCTEVDRAAAARLRRQHQGRTIVVTVGHLLQHKRIDVVIRAAEILERRGVEFAWVIVGDGGERARLEALAASCGVADRVSFTGALPRPECLGHVAAADVFVLVGEQEGFGIVYLEAMQLGVPVVAPSEAGISDLVSPDESGVLLSVSPETVADAVVACAAPGAFRSRLIAQASEVAEAYTWPAVASRWIELYREVICANPWREEKPLRVPASGHRAPATALTPRLAPPRRPAGPRQAPPGRQDYDRPGPG